VSRSPDSPGSHIAVQTVRICYIFELRKKDNVAVPAGRSVTASVVCSLTECLIRVATDVKWQAVL